MLNYNDLILPINTSECNCYICLTGRSFAHKKQLKGKGNTRKFNGTINIGINGASGTRNLPKKMKVKKVSAMKMRHKGKQVIGKGIKHPCRSSASAKQNVMKLV